VTSLSSLRPLTPGARSFPLPARNEWGEGQGEGDVKKARLLSPALSSSQPAVLAHRRGRWRRGSCFGCGVAALGRLLLFPRAAEPEQIGNQRMVAADVSPLQLTWWRGRRMNGLTSAAGFMGNFDDFQIAPWDHAPAGCARERFGLRQPSAAFVWAPAFQSARGLAQSKTSRRFRLAHWDHEPCCSAGFPACGFWRLFRLRGAPKRRSGATAASRQLPASQKHGTGMSREPADRNVCATASVPVELPRFPSRALQVLKECDADCWGFARPRRAPRSRSRHWEPSA
jgi:hypothetical protein